jgi:hypothetical protein
MNQAKALNKEVYYCVECQLASNSLPFLDTVHKRFHGIGHTVELVEEIRTVKGTSVTLPPWRKRAAERRQQRRLVQIQSQTSRRPNRRPADYHPEPHSRTIIHRRQTQQQEPLDLSTRRPVITRAQVQKGIDGLRGLLQAVQLNRRPTPPVIFRDSPRSPSPRPENGIEVIVID